ncbi:MAG: glycosyltransferase family 39 protein, partial [Anaerolineae bacterium]|nr:glycosyltransferase family 39 protein [Anaerolineae bacterium]
MNISVKVLAFWLALFLYAVYLLSFSGHFHVMDEWVGFAPANNLVQYGRPDMNQFIWTNHWQAIPPGFWGVDDHLYTKKAPGISIITAPLIWLGHLIPGLNVVHVSLLANMPVTALVAALILIWLVDLGFSTKVAFFTALGYGLCTIAWIYARMFWEPAMQALSFLVAVWAAYRAVQSETGSRWLWIFLAGVAVALSLAFRFETVPATVLIGLYLLWEFSQKQIKESKSRVAPPPLSQPSFLSTHYALRTTFNVSRFTPQALFLYIRLLTVYLAPSLLVGLGLMYFNLIRF